MGSQLPKEVKDQLSTFLRKNHDVFAWSKEDMSRILLAVINHFLDVDPKAIPVKQKKRKCSKDKLSGERDEVQKLFLAGYIKEVKYPEWLSDIVMVRKSSDKWRMSIDFTNLNKAFLKDYFPLPNIDRMVEASAGHQLLTFMESFSGYNQIFMHPADQEKMSFNHRAWRLLLQGHAFRSRKCWRHLLKTQNIRGGLR